MNYYYDTEFLEGTQKTFFGKTKPTIDLISIGIVGEDGREFYAISKDFNLKEAWNRYDIKKEWYSIDESTQSTRDLKVYWIRDNVLLPIWKELLGKRSVYEKTYHYELSEPFSIKSLSYLIKRFGKTNKQIADEVKHFTAPSLFLHNNAYPTLNFYGYYSAYDHVALCWLFGKMIDLPKSFPMYTRDLRQMLDEKIERLSSWNTNTRITAELCKNLSGTGITFGEAEKLDWSKFIKEHANYPKQSNEHNALADAKWNKSLHEFIKSI